MSIGDFKLLELGSDRGSRVYNTSGTAFIVLGGEPVARTLGSTVVTYVGSTFGQVGTDYLAGIVLTGTQAETNELYPVQSTGVYGVRVLPLNSDVTYLANPTVATAYSTQTLYNAMVGSNVLITATGSTVNGVAGTSYTVGVVANTTASTYGVVIMPLDVTAYPGKVAVAFRKGLSDLN
jgi:hypothetical protein